jgi:hypothetical protein
MNDKQSSAQTKSNYIPLPDGVFDLNILEVKTGTSKSGKPMATIIMVPTTPPYENRRLYHHVLLLEKFKPYSRSFFQSLGFNNVNFESFDFSQLVGMKARGILRSEKKDGVFRQRLVKFLSFRQDVKTLPIIPEDLPPVDVPLSEVLTFSYRGNLVIKGFRYRGEMDNRKAFDRGRKLVSVLNYFLSYLRDHYGM